MRASRLWKAISRPRNVLKGSINVQIEGLDVNFYISNKGVYTLDVELRFVVLKLRKKCSFPNSRQMSEEPFVFSSLLCFKVELWTFNFEKKLGLQMKASRLWRVISRFWNVLEGFTKAQIQGLDVNIYISNQGVHTLNFELRYVVLQLRKKCSFSY